ncbi:FtsX-like permease family protein, partial [Candidatus Bathyarchaeota archaeon]|nr:FtsX-like permease family protein [Candidatus Bathyarchaeota archaeon]
IRNSIGLFVDSIAAISLLVASVGIITTMQTSVMERTREIGLLKSLGLGRKLILLMFLGEIMIIGIVGGSISLGAGIGLAWVMINTLNLRSTPGFVVITPEFSLTIFLLAWLLFFLFSIIAGIYQA